MISDANGWPDAMREALEWALAIHFSQNRQPCMSGDPRDRLSSLQRRNMEDARDAALEALAPVVTQRERASYAAAWIAAREAGAVLAEADWLRVSDTALPAKIRALSPPADAAAALAALVEAARREAFEEAARMIEPASIGNTDLAGMALLNAAVSLRARAAGGAA